MHVKHPYVLENNLTHVYINGRLGGLPVEYCLKSVSLFISLNDTKYVPHCSPAIVYLLVTETKIGTRNGQECVCVCVCACVSFGLYDGLVWRLRFARWTLHIDNHTQPLYNPEYVNSETKQTGLRMSMHHCLLNSLRHMMRLKQPYCMLMSWFRKLIGSGSVTTKSLISTLTLSLLERRSIYSIVGVLLRK